MNIPAIIAASIVALLLVITALVTFLVRRQNPVQPNPVVFVTAVPPGTIGVLENAGQNPAQQIPIAVMTTAPPSSVRPLQRQPTTNLRAERSKAFINALMTRKQKRILAQAYSNAKREVNSLQVTNPIQYHRHLIDPTQYIKAISNMATARLRNVPRSRKTSSRRR